MPRQSESTVWPGRLPRYTGAVGFDTSTNATPFESPRSAYSLLVRGSVQPQTSFVVMPALVVPSMSATGRNDARSTLLQGNVPAIPPVQGVKAIAAIGASPGCPLPPGLWCSPSCASTDQAMRHRAARIASETIALLVFIDIYCLRSEKKVAGEARIIPRECRRWSRKSLSREGNYMDGQKYEMMNAE